MILITGAGGFIGGFLAKELSNDPRVKVRCVDIKPLDQWYQIHEQCENLVMDLKLYKNCESVTQDINEVYNLACDMGGMGFIENNKALCMLSVLINTNLLNACLRSKIGRYFYSSSACVYNQSKQNSTNLSALKEEDAYPAMPEDGYGWEKIFSERMCRHFMEDFGLECRVARYHNVYGPYGTYDGGREKAPAAICRKTINAKLTNNLNIEIWGDGEQTRSFMYIDDCIEGTLKIMKSDIKEPINLGSSELVTINQLVSKIENIAKIDLNRQYNLEAPLGVRGRNSDNTLIKSYLSWEPSIKLSDGLRITYDWISDQMQGKNEQRDAFIKGGNAG
tara:strand:+ start:629 stop:1633 length:1005 start_codon:yes stop_codon:yes gene_type:complete